MRSMVLSDWRGILGNAVLEFDAAGVTKINLDLVTEGCAVVVLNAGHTHLVAYGEGVQQVSFIVNGPFSLGIEGFTPDARTSIRIPHDRQVEAGWVDEASFVQLDLKDRDEVTPEFQRMMSVMQRNSLIREQVLREEIDKLRRDRGSK